MIGLLIKEAHDFSILSAEELEIYTNNFKQLGMKPIDFLHIIRAAKRTVYKPGEVLVQQVRSPHFLLIIIILLSSSYSSYSSASSLFPYYFPPFFLFLLCIYETTFLFCDRIESTVNSILCSLENLSSNDKKSECMKLKAINLWAQGIIAPNKASIMSLYIIFLY